MAQARHQATGVGVDSSGGPVIDPTKNVISLVEANAKTGEELRDADTKFNDAQHAHLKEIGSLRSAHAKELRANDIERYAAIRQVDTTNATAAAAQIATQIQTLAKSTEDIRKTLADAMASRDARVDERLGSLERSSSLGTGRQLATDPQMEKLTDLVGSLARTQATGAGKSEGISSSWAILVGIIMLAATLFNVFWPHVKG